MRVTVCLAAMLLSVSALFASCSSGDGGGGAPDAAEPGIEEKRQATTAKMNDLIAGAASPEIKAELEAGLALMDQFTSGEALEVFGDAYKGLATSLEDIKSINSIASVFLLESDPSAASVAVDPATGYPTEQALLLQTTGEDLKNIGMNDEDAKRFQESILKVMRNSISSGSWSSDAAHSVRIPVCFVVQSQCSARVKTNTFIANILILFIKYQITDYAEPDEISLEGATRMFDLIEANYSELLDMYADEATPTVNFFERMPALNDKIRAPKSVGGNATLASTEVVIQNRDKDKITIAKTGKYTLAASMNMYAKIDVKVVTAPAGEKCTIANASGYVKDTITNIDVNCAPDTRTVGGTMAGLPTGGTATLQLNGKGDLAVTKNGKFTFANGVELQTNYAVTVKTPPAGYSCKVENGTGKVTDNVTGVEVTCAQVTKKIAGTVSGLDDDAVVTLRLNGGSNLELDENGDFEFSTKVGVGNTYTVTIFEQPEGQTCGVANHTGTVSDDVSNVQVTCEYNFYSVAGTIEGLGMGTVVLQLNAGNDLNATGTSFSFGAATVRYGMPYNVTVETQPAGMICYVEDASGTTLGNVTDVAVKCVEEGDVLRIKTSSAIAADFGDPMDPIAAADAHCGSGYKAMISDGSTRIACTTANCSGGSSEHDNWVLRADTVYIQEGTTTVIGRTTEDAGIFTFPLMNALQTSGEDHWSGLSSTWTSFDSCGGWTDTSDGNMGGRGVANNTATGAIEAGANACDTTNRLVCVEQYVP